jgi:hypothetical protein
MSTWLSRVVPVMTAAALAATMAVGQAAAAAPRARAAGAPGASEVTGPATARSVPRLQPRSIRPPTSGNRIKLPTLRFYKASFTSAGKTYSYTSLGSDPATSSDTTKIPVTVIPIRVYVPGGSVWPTGAVKLTTGSALFHDSPVFGNTQYGDATLRSGYWKDVAAHGGKWHVLFDRPVTRPLLKVHVPSGQGTISLDAAGNGLALVNSTWLTKELSTIAKTVSAGYLVALLTYNVVGCTNYKKESTCGVAGFHGWAANSSGTHVLAWASWDDTTVFVDGESSTGFMSNMLASTLNNPFADDTVPNWSVPSQPQAGCSNRFAVGAPLIGNFLAVNGLEYQDVADLSWFARQKPSTGFQGRYSYFGTLTTLPVSC